MTDWPRVTKQMITDLRSVLPEIAGTYRVYEITGDDGYSLLEYVEELHDRLEGLADRWEREAWVAEIDDGQPGGGAVVAEARNVPEALGRVLTRLTGYPPTA